MHSSAVHAAQHRVGLKTLGIGNEPHRQAADPPRMEQDSHNNAAESRRRSALWEAMAAAQFCADGVTEGWDSDDSDGDTPEQKYMKVHSAASQVR